MSISEEIERLPLLRAPLSYTNHKTVHRSDFHHHLPEIAMVSACNLSIYTFGQEIVETVTEKSQSIRKGII